MKTKKLERIDPIIFLNSKYMNCKICRQMSSWSSLEVKRSLLFAVELKKSPTKINFEFFKFFSKTNRFWRAFLDHTTIIPNHTYEITKNAFILCFCRREISTQNGMQQINLWAIRADCWVFYENMPIIVFEVVMPSSKKWLIQLSICM